MKKFLNELFVLAIALMLFVPLTASAKGKAYEYFDFKYQKVMGSKINDTEIKIFASVDGDEKNLIDRTNEFNVAEIIWSTCVDSSCSLAEGVGDDDVWEDGKEYVFVIRITAKNGADIDVWETDKVMLNGTPIEQLDGEFGNTGNELLIKSKTAIGDFSKQEEPTEVEPPIDEPTEENPVISPNEGKACMLGISLCCTSLLGLSICIWIIIVILLIILIVIFCILKNKNKQTQPPIQQI